MSRSSSRILGMTGMQLGILAGLALLAVLSLCVLVWMYSSLLTGFSQPDTQPTAQAPAATVTPVQLATSAPAATPSATAPVVATSAPPAGWIRFQTQGAALWLPASYVGGDMAQHRSETIQSVTKLGKYFKNTASAMQTADSNTVLWMVDKNAQRSLIITTVTVQRITSTQDKTIDAFVQDDLNSNANGTPIAMLIEINETKKVTVLGLPARRLTYSLHQAGTEAMGISYYIKNGAEFWGVSYLVGPQEYVDVLPIIEQSMRTFYLGQ